MTLKFEDLFKITKKRFFERRNFLSWLRSLPPDYPLRVANCNCSGDRINSPPCCGCAAAEYVAASLKPENLRCCVGVGNRVTIFGGIFASIFASSSGTGSSFNIDAPKWFRDVVVNFDKGGSCGEIRTPSQFLPVIEEVFASAQKKS